MTIMEYVCIPVGNLVFEEIGGILRGLQNSKTVGSSAVWVEQGNRGDGVSWLLMYLILSELKGLNIIPGHCFLN